MRPVLASYLEWKRDLYIIQVTFGASERDLEHLERVL